jgi:hypothetical protein
MTRAAATCVWDLSNKATCYGSNVNSTETTWGSVAVMQSGSQGRPSCNGEPDNSTKGTANTVTPELYIDASCCISTHNYTMGNLGECKTPGGTFSSFKQDVGQNMFGRNVKVLLYDGTNYKGANVVKDLTNKPQCSQDFNYQSLMIQQVSSSSSGSSSPSSSCAPMPNKSASGGDDNTISLSLLTGCCNSVETLKLGNLGECRTPTPTLTACNCVSA